MSTSTDLREGLSEEERSTVNQLTTTGLTLVSAGFTLYPTKEENGRLVALGVAAPDAEGHEPRLVVEKDSFVGRIPQHLLKPEPDFPELHFVNVAGFDLSSSDGQGAKGADAINFNMIPDFESLSSGLHLAPDWRKRTHSCADFGEGQVVAVPDQYSLTQTCEWTTFQEPPQHQGPKLLTSCTTYAPSVQNSPTLVLTSREDPTNRISLEFKGSSVFAAFTNFAVGADAGNYMIDFAHIDAMLRLCDTPGEVRFTLGKMTPISATNWPRSGWPQWLPRLLRKNNYFVGRPHCGARQMRAPGL